MALLWFDGFETYENFVDAGVVSSAYFASFNSTDNAQTTFGDYGRRSSRGIRDLRADYYWGFILQSGLDINEFVLGFAFEQDESGVRSINTGEPFIAIFEGANYHLSVCVTPEGNFSVYRNLSTLLGTSSGATVQVRVYHFFEIKFLIHGSVGYVTIWLDNLQILSLTNQNTLQGSNAWADQFRFRGIHNNLTTLYDDLYLLSTSGSAPCNDRLGDIRVDVQRPDGAGIHTDFTPSAGSNYENVDETYPDDDTTYNDGSTIGNQDSYGLPALPSPPAGATIYGVKDQITVRKTDAGTMGVKILTVQGGSDYLSEEFALTDTFTSPARVMENNPDDSAAWEDADISGGEVGVEITS